jgi:hypothetical protein
MLKSYFFSSEKWKKSPQNPKHIALTSNYFVIKLNKIEMIKMCKLDYQIVLKSIPVRVRQVL